MKVQFTFGLWAPASGDGHGLRNLGSRIVAAMPEVKVGYTAWDDEQLYDKAIAGWEPAEPLIVVGHSFGGGKSVELCNRLTTGNRPVRHLFLIDPVPPSGWGFANNTDFVIPANVRQATCWKRTAFSTPVGIIWSCPIRNPSGNWVNFDIHGDHNALPGDATIQNRIFEIVQQIQLTS